MALKVTPAAERAIRGGHPWLFADSILKQNHDGRTGDLAVIFDAKNRFLAIGLLDKSSPIRVRILHQGQPARIDSSWFANSLYTANMRRISFENSSTNGYRLVHGENDGLPGVVIDRYDDTVVIKIYTMAWIPHLKSVVESVVTQFEPQRIILRFGRLIQNKVREVYDLVDGDIVWGPDLEGVVIFKENGLLFEADVVRGQKTGFFLDQRENRSRVEKLAKGKTVLNVFAYSGGFSLYAARGGATQVISLDLSGPALAEADRNFDRNNKLKSFRLARHETMQGDAFELLDLLGQEKKCFDMVVVDPPSFAKSRNEIERAQEAYYRLNLLALGVLQNDGILVSSSCSSRVTENDFFSIIHDAANDAGWRFREIERTAHPIDHPVGFPEGAYLKCLFGQVKQG
ncbi:MAG: class I SAM-dependent rRNA methyltransferase [Candidatus Promineifilaceae bacterium]|nr:class I SAM-dependent rRNA methyltransferase [Candidatus Promineifilaceae bacterium]